jgi:hypothetical protein
MLVIVLCRQQKQRTKSWKTLPLASLTEFISSSIRDFSTLNVASGSAKAMFDLSGGGTPEGTVEILVPRTSANATLQPDLSHNDFSKSDLKFGLAYVQKTRHSERGRRRSLRKVSVGVGSLPISIIDETTVL